jgi:signal transduction histidine kinase
MGERVDSPPATILVVDDNEANRLLARSTLEDEGYQVILANGGAESVTVFQREHPDCILLDVRMPEVDGFAACEQIRALPRGTETPIIFLTALRDIDTFDRALRAGGDDFLTKPVRPTELVVRVQTALKLRRMRVELREHFDVLKQQRDDLMRLQLQKERLSAFVVHDLKNPVNSMDLHAQLLLREKGLSESARESAARIRIEARQLNRMILNLLDLSKADEGKLSPKVSEVNLRALVDEIAAELDVNAKSRRVVLRTSLATERLRADEDLLRRILTNLVENAIRYAPADSAVTISATEVASSTEIRVADAGNGIPPEMWERVFDPFIQVDAGTERVVTRGGRGLGLTFCKLAALAHGGRIWIEDAAPGAVFCVRFPNGT